MTDAVATLYTVQSAHCVIRRNQSGNLVKHEQIIMAKHTHTHAQNYFSIYKVELRETWHSQHKTMLNRNF